MSRRNRSKRKSRKDYRSQNHTPYIRTSDLINPIVPKTDGQEEYIDSIDDNPITICDGPAGVGKSFISFGKALEYYLEPNEINRIVVVRSTFAAGEEPAIGYLPGDLNDKMGPFLAPILKDSARQLIKKTQRDYEAQSLLGGGSNTTASIMQVILSKFDIEIVPLQFMRGRTFANSFVILDEAQNCSMADFKLFLTRVGENSKIVIEGDASQKDRTEGALPQLMEKLRVLDTVGCIYLNEKDIVRSPLISDILYALDR